MSDTKSALEIAKLTQEIRELQLKVEDRESSAFFSSLRRREWDRESHYHSIRGCINGDTLTSVAMRVREWRQQTPLQRFTIEIASPGGDVFAGLGIYDCIVDAVSGGLNIDTVVRGCAASMGSLLLQAGEVRSMSRSSWIMLHEVGFVSHQLMQVAEMRDQSALLDTLQSFMVKVYAERSKLTVDEISSRCERKDWWVGATEALEVGFIDRIEE